MSAQHTPGPWRIRKFSDSGIPRIYGPDREIERAALLADVWSDADVTLIAAAPDLYEACRALVAGFGTAAADDVRLLIQGRAAIDKAEGRQP